MRRMGRKKNQTINKMPAFLTVARPLIVLCLNQFSSIFVFQITPDQQATQQQQQQQQNRDRKKEQPNQDWIKYFFWLLHFSIHAWFYFHIAIEIERNCELNCSNAKYLTRRRILITLIYEIEFWQTKVDKWIAALGNARHGLPHHNSYSHKWAVWNEQFTQKQQTAKTRFKAKQRTIVRHWKSLIPVSVECLVRNDVWCVMKW